ncbi:hypothetical protein SOVF_196880 isoform A, partial [Spinacia oleracea]
QLHTLAPCNISLLTGEATSALFLLRKSSTLANLRVLDITSNKLTAIEDIEKLARYDGYLLPVGRSVA